MGARMPAWLAATASALLACPPQTPAPHETGVPRARPARAESSPATAPPARTSTADQGRAPPRASPPDGGETGPADAPFAERGRCRSFWLVGYPEHATVSGEVARTRRASERERIVLLRTPAGPELELRFDCEPDSGPPVAAGERIRAELACSAGGFSPGCRGVLTTTTGAVRLITRSADLARHGFVVRDGPVVAERPYLSGGRERVLALRVGRSGAEVVTRPHEWVTLVASEGRFHVFGWASRWSGMRPPDAEDFLTVVVARALEDP